MFIVPPAQRGQAASQRHAFLLAIPPNQRRTIKVDKEFPKYTFRAASDRSQPKQRKVQGFESPTAHVVPPLGGSGSKGHSNLRTKRKQKQKNCAHAQPN
jgi:hypothetical protein